MGPLMTREEVAALLGIKAESVRKTLARYGITEQRGYPRQAVENLQRPGKGWRTDLHGRRSFEDSRGNVYTSTDLHDPYDPDTDPAS